MLIKVGVWLLALLLTRSMIEPARVITSPAELGRLGREQPGYAPGWNLLGIVQLEAGQPRQAADSFRRAVESDPGPPFGWFNLARAQRALGDRLGELASIDTALSRDAYFLPGILAKGETLRALGQDEDARELIRLIRKYKLPAKVNLIPFNPWPGAPYKCSTPERIRRFSDMVFEAGISAPVRTPRGRDIDAACGQLKTAAEKKSRAELERLYAEKEAELARQQ